MRLIINRKKTKVFFFTFFIAFYLLGAFFSLFFPPNLSALFIALLLSSGILMALFMLYNKYKLECKKEIKLISFICAFYVLIQLINFRSPLSVLYPLNALLVGYVISRTNLNLIILYIELGVVSSILFFFMINGYNPNIIFDSGSRNLISVILLFSSLLIYFQEFKSMKRLSLLPAILCVIFSVWAVGRSGIICSIILFTVIFYYSLARYKPCYKILVIVVFSILLCCLLVFLSRNVELLDFFIRFEERGLDYGEDERSVMLNLYMSKLSINSIFSGYNYFNDSKFAYWSYNVHNSFISFHALWGVGAFFFFLWISKKLFFLLRNERLLFFLALLFLLRAFSDAIAFNGVYDFVFASILFYTYINLKNEKQ